MVPSSAADETTHQATSSPMAIANNAEATSRAQGVSRRVGAAPGSVSLRAMAGPRLRGGPGPVPSAPRAPSEVLPAAQLTVAVGGGCSDGAVWRIVIRRTGSRGLQPAVAPQAFGDGDQGELVLGAGDLRGSAPAPLGQHDAARHEELPAP